MTQTVQKLKSFEECLCLLEEEAELNLGGSLIILKFLIHSKIFENRQFRSNFHSTLTNWQMKISNIDSRREKIGNGNN